MSGRRRWGGWVFAVLEVALLVAVPALAWTGFRAVLDTTEGQAVDPELDPSEPGYEAFLSPTPVELVIGVDEAGGLSWVTVLVLGGPAEQGGAVLFVPPATVANAGDELGDLPLGFTYALGGTDALVPSVAYLLGVGFDEVTVVEPGRIASLFEPVTPLAITLPERIGDFDAGENRLSAEQVVELFGLRAAGESDVNRFLRQELVWRAWLDAVAASDDPDAVPGETTSGIGRYVRALAAGVTTIELLPVDPVDGPAVGDEFFEADLDDVRSLVLDRVPFPVGVRPGARPQVRVLDAVGVEGLALRVARDAARGGGQVTVVGNADRFGQPLSRVVYFDENLADAAADIAEAVGITEIQRQEGPNPNDLVDITVVVGTDLAAAYGGTGG